MKKLFATNGFTRLAAFTLLAAFSTVSLSVSAQINPAVLPASGPLSKQAMSRMLLTDATRAGNRIVAVGDRGYVVFSDNNGESWERAKTPASLPLLSGVYFSDANTAWVVGHDLVILKSVDHGKEWTQANSSAKDQRALMGIVFTDANTGFVVGAYGAFYETGDGGKTWASRKVIPPAVVAKNAVKAEKGNRESKGHNADKGSKSKELDLADDAEKSADEDKHLNAIIKLTNNNLFIAGEAGTLLSSTDNGKTWSRIASPYKGSFFGAVAGALTIARFLFLLVFVALILAGSCSKEENPQTIPVHAPAMSISISRKNCPSMEAAR
ncbi:MAG: YCF48-related protein [Pseudomonadota bacterium]